MQRNAKVLSIILALVLALNLSGGWNRALGADGKRTIGIIQYVEHMALDASREGFVDALTENGYVIGENLEIDYQNAQGDAANLSTISDRFVGKKVDLILAIATPAAQSVAGRTSEIPILGTAITDYVVARLADSNEVPGGNVSGTNDMNPIREQIELLVKLAPDAEVIGLLYTSSEDNSILQAQIAKEIAAELGLKYVEVTISNSNEVQQATQSIVKRADAIYIPTDNIFASAMPIVHGVTSQSKTPVVCGEAGMVKTGGLATLAINYYNLGYQTGLMALRVLAGEDPARMPIESAKNFDFAINGKVAEEIGLEIPADLLEYVIDGD
ncbi:MAG: ABC transporter substrate-binding protein [Firmicutes bacterium]|nr:ABC transporter substrate-binding protein [Bacillota bacterium]